MPMQTDFDKRISKIPGDLPAVFFEKAERQQAIKHSLINNRDILLIHNNPAEKIEEAIEIHANYMRGWADILKIYPERDATLVEKFPWYRAGSDDVKSIMGHNQKDNLVNDRSFRTWCTQYNQHSRTDTQVLADSWAYVALAEPRRLDSSKHIFNGMVVPLHLTVLADQSQSENSSIDNPKMPICIPYPALSSVLDIYSNQKMAEAEEEDKQKDQTENQNGFKVAQVDNSQSVAPKPYVNSWYDAVEASIKQGFTLYKNLSVGDRCWPDRLYFRWAIDLSPLYHAYYENLVVAHFRMLLGLKAI